ncbi:MAG: EAL domain-containing protein [Betaproteobacteria bacterium]|nr:EAL domain-containing protein [Betaproteobacteria bacterium]
MSAKRTSQPTADSVAVLVIESSKFERRSLCRLMRAAGAQRVAEAANLEGARHLLAVRQWPHWLLVADPDRLGEDCLYVLRDLAVEQTLATALLLTQRRQPEAEGLRSRAAQCGLPVLAVMRKPLSAEQAGTLLRGLGQPAATATKAPSLSRDELNECLRSGRVRARFEPKINLQSGRPVACEAISYVSHARYGEVPAAGFGHAMAQLGAQRVMTATVLRDAAALVRSLRAKSLDAKVSVNLGYEVLSECGDANALDAYVRTLGVAAADLVLEIDAGRHAASPNFADNLARLKLRGYALALDHPATTLALDNPAHEHFCEVKLSWPDATAAHSAPEHQSLAAAVVNARKQGMTACAVGVRTLADLTHARQAGFEAGQGELFAASMLAAETVLWVEREERNRSFADRAQTLNQAS